MQSHYEPSTVRIPARIFPGMFRGELQVTVHVGGEEINLMVSEDFVEFDKDRLSAEGVDGVLIVDIVKSTPEGYLVHLPGEVQGATNRVEYSRT